MTMARMNASEYLQQAISVLQEISDIDAARMADDDRTMEAIHAALEKVDDQVSAAVAAIEKALDVIQLVQCDIREELDRL